MLLVTFYWITWCAVPAGYPTSIRAEAYSPTAAILSWEEIECSLRNGPITDHEYTLVDVSSGTVHSGTISMSMIAASSYGSISLLPCVQYMVSMAAVNPAGRGPFSPAIPLNINNESGMHIVACVVHQSSAGLNYASCLSPDSDHYQKACMLVIPEVGNESTEPMVDEAGVDKPRFSGLLTIVVPAVGFLTLGTIIFILFGCVIYRYNKKRKKLKGRPYGKIEHICKNDPSSIGVNNDRISFKAISSKCTALTTKEIR